MHRSLSMPCCPETHRARLSHNFRRNGSLERVPWRGHSGREPMLPMPLQFIVAMLVYAINERMARTGYTKMHCAVGALSHPLGP
jgi:hypothetical protein